MIEPRYRAHGARMATRRWPFHSPRGLTTLPTMPAAPTPRRPRTLGPLLALLCGAVYVLTSAGSLTSFDGGVMYDTTIALVQRHTLALPPHHHGMPGLGGHFYSKYGIAQSVAEIPLYLLGQALTSHPLTPLAHALALALTMLTNAVITALAVWLFFLLAHEVSENVRGAAIAALLVGLASPYWPYAKTDFSEPLLALALTGAVLFLVRARVRPTAATFALSGLFVAVALLTKLTALFALPALGLYTLYVARNGGARWRRLVAWGLPVLAGMALVAGYNLVRYGHLSDTGYRAGDLPFHAPPLTGLAGLLVSPGKGLLWYCPLLLVALALWPLLLRRRRAEGLLALGLVVPTVAIFATYPVWWGGICWGPRYLVPIVPLLLLPLAFLPRRLPRVGVARQAVVSLVALSVVVQVLGVAVHPNRFVLTGIHDQQYQWVASDSPLLGHAWLAGYDVARIAAPGDAALMIATYPWRHQSGLSLSQRLVITQWPYWWWNDLGSYGLSARAQLALAAAVLLIVALATAFLLRLRRATAPLPYDRGRMATRV